MPPKAGIFNHFSWFYVLAFSIFICFLVILSVSSLGSIKLGNDEEEPNSACCPGWPCSLLPAWAWA